MDIQSALALLGNHEEKSKFFKGQVIHFNLEGGSSLKEYLDRINGDSAKWLRDLPKGIKSKPRFHKYKAPIYALLVHKDVVAAFGEMYCSTVLRSMKSAFKDSIDEIINERIQSSTVEEDTMDSIHEEESDYDGSVLDIDSLEVTTPCAPEKKSDEVVDYKHQYEILKTKYNTLNIKYESLGREYNTMKECLRNAWEVMKTKR
jgi:hypothetical protein